jgi:hypothetical protein
MKRAVFAASGGRSPQSSEYRPEGSPAEDRCRKACAHISINYKRYFLLSKLPYPLFIPTYIVFSQSNYATTISPSSNSIAPSLLRAPDDADGRP